jgi:hypothetical protein
LLNKIELVIRSAAKNLLLAGDIDAAEESRFFAALQNGNARERVLATIAVASILYF